MPACMNQLLHGPVSMAQNSRVCVNIQGFQIRFGNNSSPRLLDSRSKIHPECENIVCPDFC